MKCASALSTATSSETAIGEVLSTLADQLQAVQADFAVAFVSPHHANHLQSLAAECRKRGLARHVLACTGETIVGADREVEGDPAISLWAIKLPEGSTVRPVRFGWPGGQLADLPGEIDRSKPDQTLLLVADPFGFAASFTPDKLLAEIEALSPGLKIVGGMASGGNGPGENRLVLDDDVFEDGAVGLWIDAPDTIATVVSQGCRPIGRPMIVTRADMNLIKELGRRPAIESLRETFAELDEDDQALVRQGLHVGRVINEYQETFGRGDFLVRNVMGADDEGGIAITDLVRVGQTVQFHVRDASTADEDLRTLLATNRQAHPKSRAIGALLFSCNGRGSRLFPTTDHDVKAIHDAMGPIPVAGFFAMGEFGPIGGKTFVHGFTASVAVFHECDRG